MNADLAAAPHAEVVALAERLVVGLAVEHLTVPQQGLYLLQMQEPILGDRFHMGEVPAATAAVELVRADGARARGGAVLMHADRATAVAAAVCDAVAHAGWEGAEAVRALAEQGAIARARAERLRAGIRERTRVSFAELVQEDA